MFRRRLILLVLFSEVLCVSDAVPTQSCLFIGVLTLFNQLTFAQERIFGVIPKDIEHTGYTILAKPRVIDTANFFFAVVIGDSPMAIILNQNYDIIKEVPANIFTSNTPNTKSEIKSLVSAKNIETHTSNSKYRVKASSDMTALSPIKTEEFPSTSYAGNVKLHPAEAEVIQQNTNNFIPSSNLPTVGENAIQEHTNNLIPSINLLTGGENAIQENTNNFIPSSNLPTGGENAIQENTNNFIPSSNLPTVGENAIQENTNNFIRHSSLPTGGVNVIQEHEIQENTKNLIGNSNPQAGGVNDHRAKVNINRSPKVQEESIADLLLRAAEERLRELGFGTSNHTDRRYENTNKNMYPPQTQSSKLPNIETSAHQLNLAENIGSEKRQTYSNIFRNTNENIHPPQIQSSNLPNIETSAPNLNLAGNMGSEKKQTYSNIFRNTNKFIHPPQIQSSKLPNSETSAPNFNLAGNMGSEKKQTYSNIFRNTNKFIHPPQKQSSKFPNSESSAPNLNLVENMGSEKKQAYSNIFSYSNENIHAPQTQLSKLPNIKTSEPTLNLAESMGNKIQQTYSNSLKSTIESIHPFQRQSFDLAKNRSSAPKLNLAENIGNKRRQTYSNSLKHNNENKHPTQQTQSTKRPYISTSTSMLSPAENIGNKRKQTYSNSVILTLLWNPEDIGKRRVIKQEGAHPQTSTVQTVKDNGDIAKTRQHAGVNIPEHTKYSAENSQYETYLRDHFIEKANVKDLEHNLVNGGSKQTLTNMKDPNLSAIPAMPMDGISRFGSKQTLTNMKDPNFSAMPAMPMDGISRFKANLVSQDSSFV